MYDTKQFIAFSDSRQAAAFYASYLDRTYRNILYKRLVVETLKNSNKTLGNFNGFLNRSNELQHSYEKFRFSKDVTKPPFEEVYRVVKSYIRDAFPKK